MAQSQNAKPPVSEESLKKEPFWKFVDKRLGQGPKGDCWGWSGATCHSYGHLRRNGKTCIASRISWEIHYGQIPKGLHVLHSCDNPPCTNPKHLFLGTHLDNMRDMSDKQRYKLPFLRGSAHGRSKLTEKQVKRIRKLSGTNREIAEQFGVHLSLIGLIKQRKIWTHV